LGRDPGAFQRRGKTEHRYAKVGGIIGETHGGGEVRVNSKGNKTKGGKGVQSTFSPDVGRTFCARGRENS